MEERKHGDFSLKSNFRGGQIQMVQLAFDVSDMRQVVSCLLNRPATGQLCIRNGRATALRYKLHTKLAFSPSYSTTDTRLTSPSTDPKRRASGQVVTRVLMFKVSNMTRPQKVGSDPQNLCTQVRRHTTNQRWEWRKVKKPESGGQGVTDGPRWSQGQR